MKRGTRNEGEVPQKPVKIDDFRMLAQARLPVEIFEYIDSGACDEFTTRANRRDLDEIRLLPLCLRDVGVLDLTISIHGHLFALPLGFSPTAFHRLVHDGGEVTTATVARVLNVPMIVSAMSSVALEDIVLLSGNQDLWFQTYIFRDRELTKELIRRAERAGYKCIVVTVGCPVAGKRDRNITSRFALPDNVVAANFKRRNVVVHNNPIHSVEGAELDPSLTWRDIDWLRSNTELPVILKGIMNPLDAERALDLDVSGLIVSNHGGRQLDTTESTIRILPEIAAAISGRVPLLIDGGFRRGTDIVKAIAFGADGILLGRPVVWALAAGGERGITDACELLTAEFRIAMQIVGCSGIKDIRENSAAIIRR